MFKHLAKSKLSRHVARMNAISTGPGSVLLPEEVKSVELIFKRMNSDGHMGPKMFWKENLPRVQFHNPKLPIKVIRIEPDNPKEDYKKIPAVLKIHYKDGSVKDADVKYKHSEEILEEFIKLTNAQPVA